MRRLTSEQLAVIVRLIEEDKPSSDVAQEFNCHKKTVRRAVARKRQFGSPNHIRSPGRPRKTTARVDRQLLHLTRKNPYITQRQLQSEFKATTGEILSRKSIVSRLAEQEIAQEVRKPRPLLSKVNVQKRYNWAKEYITKDPSYFFPFLYTDECRIAVYQSDAGPRYAWMRPSERELPRNLKKSVKKSPSAHIWCGISLQGRTELVQLSDHVDSVEYMALIENHLIPEIPRLSYNGKFILLQDGASCHRSGPTRAFLAQKNIEVAPHCAQSPDMNPIEHMWGHLKKRVDERAPKSLKHLKTILKEEYEKLPDTLLQNLCLSYPRRIRACYEAKGYNTSY